MQRDPRKLLQEASARRTRIKPPNWTLRIYNWWYANTAYPPRRETENLCRFFWIPVRAAGLWIKLRLDRHLSAIEQLMAITMLALYATIITLGAITRGLSGFVAGLLAGPVVLWLALGIMTGWVAQGTGKNPLRVGDAHADHRDKIEQILRPTMAVGSKLQKLSTRSTVRSILVGGFLVLCVLMLLSFFAALIIEYGWLRFFAGVGIVIVAVGLILLALFLLETVSQKRRRSFSKPSALRETASFVWAYMRAKKMKICPFVDVGEPQAH